MHDCILAGECFCTRTVTDVHDPVCPHSNGFCQRQIVINGVNMCIDKDMVSTRWRGFAATGEQQYRQQRRIQRVTAG